MSESEPPEQERYSSGSATLLLGVMIVLFVYTWRFVLSLKNEPQTL
jgi:hypothetical protein